MLSVYNSLINNIFNFCYLVRIRWGDQAILLMTCYHTFFCNEGKEKTVTIIICDFMLA